MNRKCNEHQVVYLFYRPQNPAKQAQWIAKGYNRYAVCKTCRKIGWISWDNKIRWWRESTKTRQLRPQAECWNNEVVMDDQMQYPDEWQER